MQFDQARLILNEIAALVILFGALGGAVRAAVLRTTWIEALRVIFIGAATAFGVGVLNAVVLQPRDRHPRGPRRFARHRCSAAFLIGLIAVSYVERLIDRHERDVGTKRKTVHEPAGTQGHAGPERGENADRRHRHRAPDPVGLDPALRLYDQHMLERPWASATITLVRPRERPAGAPDILLRITAERQLVGLWSSWVETEQGRQCGLQGQTLLAAGVAAQRWSWSGWFGVECPLPANPFRVCIRSIVETRWQARDVAGPFCSNDYNTASATMSAVAAGTSDAARRAC